MTLENFKYWLQGYLELSTELGAVPVDSLNIIREHLKIFLERDDFTHFLEGLMVNKAILYSGDLKVLKEKLNEQFVKITPSKTPLRDQLKFRDALETSLRQSDLLQPSKSLSRGVFC